MMRKVIQAACNSIGTQKEILALTAHQRVCLSVVDAPSVLDSRGGVSIVVLEPSGLAPTPPSIQSILGRQFEHILHRLRAIGAGRAGLGEARRAHLCRQRLDSNWHGSCERDLK